MEVENFLRTGDETQTRSLIDPWELEGTLLFEPEVLLNTIFMKGGEFAPLYQNVATFYRMNMYWWKRHEQTFQKWWEVIDDEYTPLWDRDGYETIDDHTEETGTLDTNTTGKEIVDDDTTKNATTKETTDDDTTLNEIGKTTLVGKTTDAVTSSTTTGKDVHDWANKITSGESHSTTDGTDEHQVSAFDSNTYQPSDKHITHEHNDTTTGSNESVDGNSHETGSSTTNSVDTKDTTDTTDTTKSTTGTDDKVVDTIYSETGTDDRTTTTEGSIDTDTSGKKDYNHALHSWGNWGITTTAQKLLEQELRIRAFDIYEHMADIFIDEMLIRVYI